MRMYENFSDCRVLSYCVMSNHFHILLEVPPKPKEGITDEELLKRLGFLYSDGALAEVRNALDGVKNGSGTAEEKARARAEIHERFTYRMNDLSEFMKGLLIRFTRWFNQNHSRKGTLWEERFKSVIVESGTAARTMAAYIDLNPVRAGMVENPEEYRWSSYGEAVGGGRKGNGKKARGGLVRAFCADEGVGFEPERWPEVSRRYRRLMGMALDRKPQRAKVSQETRKSDGKEGKSGEAVGLEDLGIAKMLRCRVRYFTDGAVIGSKDFVNAAFAASRERFSKKRTSGARKMRGVASAAKGELWSARDLRVGI
jgi:REP element-mobilizing transposase RayT